MEEADKFIKEACKHLECSYADDDEIEFSTPQIFEFLVRCIWSIDARSKQTIPSYVYPKVITARLHLGNAISSYLQKFHIRGDTALHTVLYGNINNLRSTFIELIRKLPSDGSAVVSPDKGHQFLVNVVDIVKSQPAWVPSYCRGLVNKQEWILPNNHPENFPLFNFDKPSKHLDPRKWISQYVNSVKKESTVNQVKPVIPPKPVFAKSLEHAEKEKNEVRINETSEVDENAVLQTQYDEKLQEYKELLDEHAKIETQNKELELKLSKYDPDLIEALQNPEEYVQQLSEKIAKLNKQMEEDTLTLENRKLEAAKQKMELAEDLGISGIQNEEMRRVSEMEEELKKIDEEIESNLLLAEKLKTKLSKIDENQVQSMYDFEKRSKELDAIVRKQEEDLMKMQEERILLRKQEERESEAVNRSFAIIYNILLQHCDHYRGRLAMESFTRIHLYCMEILEMLRENGALKQAVGLLESEIFVEEQKQYEKQFDLLNRDFHEITDLNNKLFTQIKMHKPDFQMPAL